MHMQLACPRPHHPQSQVSFRLSAARWDTEIIGQSMIGQNTTQALHRGCILTQ